jgi:hypothetical protein
MRTPAATARTVLAPAASRSRGKCTTIAVTTAQEAAKANPEHDHGSIKGNMSFDRTVGGRHPRRLWEGKVEWQPQDDSETGLAPTKCTSSPSGERPTDHDREASQQGNARDDRTSLRPVDPTERRKGRVV